MAPIVQSKKRKAVTRDVTDTEIGVSDIGSEIWALNGTFSDSEGGSAEEEEADLSELEGEVESDEDEKLDEDGLDSDEIPSEGDDEASGLAKVDVQQPPTEGNVLERNGSLEAGGDESEEVQRNYTITEDANGNPRYVYNDISPVYDSDDSDAPAATNTIGNIPLSFYDSYPHIGYDINGKKISRPAKGEALDALLDSIEVPKGWTGLTDPSTGKPLQLSREELGILKRIQMNEVPEEGYDPYPNMVEYFTSKTEIMPLSAAPEPKRRFVPSKHEAKRVMKIVRAIREGRILPYKPPSEEEDEDPGTKRYDIWANEEARPDHPMNIPAPKLPPPGYDESYHPPPEYLPDKAERAAWEEADDEDKAKEYLPTNHDSLRKVPGYDKFLKEKFERCLDLYLAPRVRRNKLNIDPESLLPKLPNPDELRPFPTTCATLFRGHEGRVRSLGIDPSGTWLASGGDDGTVRIWELLTGRQIWKIKLGDEEAVNVVRWRPGKDAVILSAAVGEHVYLIVPPHVDPESETRSREVLDAGWGYASGASNAATNGITKKESPVQWTRPGSGFEDEGVLVKFSLRSTVKVLSWHRRGEYFATVSPRGQSSAVAIHTLSKHLTQLPFRRLKGLAQSAQFHPSKPIFFVATQRMIRSYDLSKQELLKILQPGARWISSFDLHPGGDNLIVGSYDKRLLWHDLDLSTRPYKTLRYHKKAIRAVKFHQGGLPLFADASDDGSLQIFHGKVVGDLMENATIVPLKVLRGHQVKRELGVLDIDWHPREPWCVSAGADGTCRLWA
ncbi:Ribosome biogenesis protein erb1 [Acarospora aff. strigata]|nr:Ribosome biogenesis protein erb1 [Acarospora aff. strigata]